MTDTPSWVMTYNSLVSTVLQYLERSDQATINQIPTFITLCEYEVAQQIKTLGQLQVVESQLTAGNNKIQKPSRWRKTVSFNVTIDGVKQPVFLRKYEYLLEYSPDETVVGVPQFYADYNYDWWLISPTPDQHYDFEVLYYERIAPLSFTNQTNFLTQNAPNVMLFGTLLQAQMFLKDDQRQIFQQKYDQAIQALKAEDVTRLGDRQAVALDS
jgi:hypothetical protein